MKCPKYYQSVPTQPRLGLSGVSGCPGVLGSLEAVAESCCVCDCVASVVDCLSVSEKNTGEHFLYSF